MARAAGEYCHRPPIGDDSAPPPIGGRAPIPASAARLCIAPSAGVAAGVVTDGASAFVESVAADVDEVAGFTLVRLVGAIVFVVDIGADADAVGVRSGATEASAVHSLPPH